MAAPRTPAGRAKETHRRLTDEYPGTAAELCELKFETPFQLLTATILSAQTTDERVNATTPALFARFPDAEALAAAHPGEVEQLLATVGLFRNKTKSIIGMAQALERDFGGEVPTRIEDLVSLPGVGRKTANVVLSVAIGQPGLPVDTHVLRLSMRLGLTEQTDPVKVEAELMPMVPKEIWGTMSLRMILHGRRVCVARRPRCEDCVLNDYCPSSVVPQKRGGKAGKEST